MRPVILSTLVVTCLLGADEPKKADAKKDKDTEAIQGKWQMASVVRNGEVIPSNFLATGELVVKGDVYKVSLNDISATATFKLDPSKSPKQIDFTYTDGANKGQTIPGIYELKGEELKVCRGLDDKTSRPKNLEAPADSELISVVWKKSKAAAPDEPAPKATVAAKSEPLAAKPLTPADEKELKLFEGTWVFESLVINGTTLPLEGLKTTTLTLKGDKFDMVDPAGSHKGTFRFDLSAKPKKIDMTFTEGPEVGNTIQAIYELDADTYKVCVALGANSRPTEFASKPRSGFALEVLKREKK
jgi:uncharacterized protein (TIGR03067 family)